MGSQQLCLKWNNHQSNLIDVFDELLENESFVDVTLACEGVSLKAHKVVLSACSPFFKVLLKDNPCKHPIIIMKDMKFDQLKDILQFMYKGEVSISQDELSSLLQAAETLQVKGLAEVYRNQQVPGATEQTYEAAPAAPLPPVATHGNKKKRKRPNDEVLHVEPKSLLESSLLGELDSSSSNGPPASSKVPNGPSSSILNASLTNFASSDPEVVGSACLDFSSSGTLQQSQYHAHHKDPSDVDSAALQQQHDSRSSLSPMHDLSPAFQHSPGKGSVQECSDEFDENEQKPVIITPHVDDLPVRSGSSDDMDAPLDGSLLYKQSTANNSQDLTAAAIATQGSLDGKSEVRRRCHICNKVLKSAQINRHIRAIHMNARFECEFCKATYNDRSNLKRHMKTAHYNVPSTVFSLLTEHSTIKNENNNIECATDQQVAAVMQTCEPDIFPTNDDVSSK